MTCSAGKADACRELGADDALLLMQTHADHVEILHVPRISAEYLVVGLQVMGNVRAEPEQGRGLPPQINQENIWYINV